MLSYAVKSEYQTEYYASSNMLIITKPMMWILRHLPTLFTVAQ